jgi:hypothetical protein
MLYAIEAATYIANTKRVILETCFQSSTGLLNGIVLKMTALVNQRLRRLLTNLSLFLLLNQTLLSGCNPGIIFPALLVKSTSPKPLIPTVFVVSLAT